MIDTILISTMTPHATCNEMSVFAAAVDAAVVIVVVIIIVVVAFNNNNRIHDTNETNGIYCQYWLIISI